MNVKNLKILTLAAYIIMITTNYLAIALPLGGRSTGEISDNYPNLFAPAGYAFSIWGIIYTLLGIYIVYQFWSKKNNLIKKINRIFIINAILNSLWILAWHYDFIWLSVIIMIGLLITLIKITDTIKSDILDKKESQLISLPFSVYFGWITVATIANITVFLVSTNWSGFIILESVWTSIVLLVGALIGILRIKKDKNIAFGLVLIWAYTAILFKHMSASYFNGKYPEIIFTTIICLILFIFFTSSLAFKKAKK